MKLIKIVKGTFGYRQKGSGITLPKCNTDPPFEVDDDVAERLVMLGVAVIAAGLNTSKPENNDGKDSKGRKGGNGSAGEFSFKDDDSSGGDVAVDSVMSLTGLERAGTAILERLAVKYDVDISDASNNKERARLIYADTQNKAYVIYKSDCNTDDIDDGESPPNLRADDPLNGG